MAQVGSFLSGADSALKTFLALKQQRTENDARERQLGVYEDANNREKKTFAQNKLYQENDTLTATLMDNGYIDPESGDLIADKIDAGLASRDPKLLELLPQIATQYRRGEAFKRGLYDNDQFRFTTIDPVRLEKNHISVIGEYPDGRKGPFTLAGTSEDDDLVAAVPVESAGRTIANGYKLRIKPLSNLGGSSALGRASMNKALGFAIAGQSNGGEAQSTRLADPDSVIAERIIDSIDTSNRPNAVGASRQFVAELSKYPPGSKEHREYLWGRAKELGVKTDDLVKGEPETFSSEKLGAPGNYSDEFVLGRLLGTTAAERVKRFDEGIAALDRVAEQRRATQRVGANQDRLEASYQERRDELVRQRADYIKQQNQVVWDGFKASKKQAEDGLKREGATEGGKAYWSERLTDVEQKMASFTKNGGVTPAQQTADYVQLEKRILSKLKTASPEEVVTAARSGQLAMSPGEVTALRNYAVEAGVDPARGNIMQQLSDRLPKEPVIAILSQMIGQSEAGSAKELALINALGRVAQTGDMFEGAAERRNSLLTAVGRGSRDPNAPNFDDYTKVEGQLSDALGQTEQFLSPTIQEDGTTNARPATIEDVKLWSRRLATPLSKIKMANAGGYGDLAQQGYDRLLGQAAVAVGIVADQKQSGGLFGWFQDKWYDYFGTQPSQDFYAQNLRNIRVNPDAVKSGQVREVYVVDDAGRRTGKVITASELEKVAGGTLFDLFAQFGRLNTQMDMQRAAASQQR